MSALRVLLLVTACHGLGYGPCPNHPLYPVEVDVTKWKGDIYVNIEAINNNTSCQWISRCLTYNNCSGLVNIKDHFLRKENGIEYTSDIEATYISKGLYTFDVVIPDTGETACIYDYFVHYNPPHLSCHVVCTDSEYYKDGQYQFFCDSQYPDLPKCYAPVIKEIVEKNNIAIEKMMIVDNCNCSNIPYLHGPSKCEKTTLEEFLYSE